jgi:hypothetical protein
MEMKKKEPVPSPEKDAIVIACINFQRARRDLARYQGTNDLEALDRMSSRYYNLYNRLLAQSAGTEPKKSRVARRQKSPRQTLVTRIIHSFKGSRDELGVQDILARVLKGGWETKSKKPMPMVWSALSTHPALFRRVDRGTYKLKIRAVKLAATAKTEALTA